MNLQRATLRELALLLVAMVPTLSAQTQANLAQQSCQRFQNADRSLNDVYSKILKVYADDKQFLEKLKNAQRAWLAFRDAEMEALYPKTDEYGSVYPMCRCSTLQTLTENRTTELKRWLDGMREGDVCAGSLRVN